MRIISQDGTIDIPYDYFSLTIATGKYEDVEVAICKIEVSYGTSIVPFCDIILIHTTCLSYK